MMTLSNPLLATVCSAVGYTFPIMPLQFCDTLWHILLQSPFRDLPDLCNTIFWTQNNHIFIKWIWSNIYYIALVATHLRIVDIQSTNLLIKYNGNWDKLHWDTHFLNWDDHEGTPPQHDCYKFAINHTHTCNVIHKRWQSTSVIWMAKMAWLYWVMWFND